MSIYNSSNHSLRRERSNLSFASSDSSVMERYSNLEIAETVDRINYEITELWEKQTLDTPLTEELVDSVIESEESYRTLQSHTMIPSKTLQGESYLLKNSGFDIERSKELDYEVPMHDDAVGRIILPSSNTQPSDMWWKPQLSQSGKYTKKTVSQIQISENETVKKENLIKNLSPAEKPSSANSNPYSTLEAHLPPHQRLIIGLKRKEKTALVMPTNQFPCHANNLRIECSLGDVKNSLSIGKIDDKSTCSVEILVETSEEDKPINIDMSYGKIGLKFMYQQLGRVRNDTAEAGRDQAGHFNNLQGNFTVEALFSSQLRGGGSQVNEEPGDYLKEFKKKLKGLGFFLRLMKKDGNCLFRSLADQLDNNEELHERYRKISVKFLRENEDYIKNFVCVETADSFQEYTERMETLGTWGGHPELYALSEALNLLIILYVKDQECICIGNPNRIGVRVVRLAFHVKQKHYDSVRIDGKEQAWSELSFTKNGAIDKRCKINREILHECNLMKLKKKRKAEKVLLYVLRRKRMKEYNSREPN